MLRQFPYSELCRADSDWEFTEKVDRIKTIGGGNADVLKPCFHLPDAGKLRENKNCEHTVRPVRFRAFVSKAGVNVFHKFLVAILTRQLLGCIRMFSCCEPKEICGFVLVVFVVVIGCCNLDAK